MLRYALPMILSALATPALADTIPASQQGVWDVSAAACAPDGGSMTRVSIAPRSIDTFGGPATVAEVVRTGPVTFVAADYLQLEGAAEVGAPERVYFRLTQRDGPDRLNFVWKGVQAVDLVRCGEAGRVAAHPQDPPVERVQPILVGP